MVIVRLLIHRYLYTNNNAVNSGWGDEWSLSLANCYVHLKDPSFKPSNLNVLQVWVPSEILSKSTTGFESESVIAPCTILVPLYLIYVYVSRSVHSTPGSRGALSLSELQYIT